MTLGILTAYMCGVLAIGLTSHRLFRGTSEDYFVATRSIGPFVLLMSLFGTNMTAFSLLGASGEAYRIGIGVFGLMGSSSALVIPIVFVTIGTRVWSVGKRHGLLTQAQLMRARFGSDLVGLLLFGFLVLLVIPYLLIGVKGGGLTLSAITGGSVPAWVGGLVITLVVLIYVTYGGLRGTAWANTFQTLVFMVLGTVTLFFILNRLGGLDAALSRLEVARPDLLVRGDNILPLKYLSYMLIPLSAGMFPHLFMHWLSAKKAASFKLSVVAYPLCMVAVWVPSVLLGVLGRDTFADLEGPAAGSVLIRMIEHHAPEVLAGLLGAGVLAAVMSSLDSQVLALGTMFTQDVVRHYGLGERMSERRQVLVARGFVVSVLFITYLLSLVVDTSIFGLAIWSFSGFAALVPLIVATLFWRRATAAGALASVIVTAATWIFFFARGWSTPGYSINGTGLMPVVIMFAASTLAVVVVSLLTRPPDDADVDRFITRASSRTGSTA